MLSLGVNLTLDVPIRKGNTAVLPLIIQKHPKLNYIINPNLFLINWQSSHGFDKLSAEKLMLDHARNCASRFVEAYSLMISQILCALPTQLQKRPFSSVIGATLCL